jgi:hypothetical protein
VCALLLGVCGIMVCCQRCKNRRVLCVHCDRGVRYHGVLSTMLKHACYMFALLIGVCGIMVLSTM